VPDTQPGRCAQALSVAVNEPGMVAYTLVDPLLAETVERVAEEHGLFASIC